MEKEEYEYKSGAVYKGEWLGGFRDGKGMQIWIDGAKYQGEWKYGHPCGMGIFSHANGDIYEGQF